MDIVVCTKNVLHFANNKPWITRDVKELLNNNKKRGCSRIAIRQRSGELSQAEKGKACAKKTGQIQQQEKNLREGRLLR